MTVSAAGLPECVATYLTTPVAELAELSDSVFAPDAVVRDEGRSHQGAAGVHDWLADLAANFTLDCTIRRAVPGPGFVVAETTYAGDFPGSPVDRYLHFSIADGRISALTISD
ncbi:nuclear transport factor 2 family protein [Streptomyces cadmiisoli]|uniref:nuclear transport factor 2 family protein n=1 Tax=Streptomyces cadmiisoli TaxID=2184053 RepID=UPI0036518269